MIILFKSAQKKINNNFTIISNIVVVVVNIQTSEFFGRESGVVEDTEVKVVAGVVRVKTLQQLLCNIVCFHGLDLIQLKKEEEEKNGKNREGEKKKKEKEKMRRRRRRKKRKKRRRKRKRRKMKIRSERKLERKRTNISRT